MILTYFIAHLSIFPCSQHKLRKAYFLVTIVFLIFNGQGLAKHQKPSDDDKHKLLRADSVTAEHELGIVVARGNVHLFFADLILKADVVTYNQQTDIVTASGNVTLTQTTGEVTFANYVELTGDYKEGVIKEVRMIMADDAKLAAVLGKRREGKETQLNKVVYSPCKVCRQHPETPPLWQIKSQTALWDHEKHDINYTDTVIEMFGVPVLYTPYFRHPDPHIKRRSGFLAPKLPLFGSTTDHGAIFRIPYYYVISRDKDISVSPLITTKGGVFVGTEYRQRLSNGKIKIAGSVGQARRIVDDRTDRTSNRTRWHTDSQLRLNINENWRAGADILRTGDQTYLRQYRYYGHTSDNILTSKAYAEGFYNRNYILFEGLAFQGMRENDLQSRIPIIPLFDAHFLSKPSSFGDRWSLDANALAAIRNNGTDTRRFSLKGGWQVPFNSSFGDVYTLGLSMRGDFYNNENFTIGNSRFKEGDGVQGRLFPQAYLDWRYPFVKLGSDYHIIFEPVASLIGARTFGNQRKFPNEDSIILEPDDYSLLRESRFPGLDRIDDGSRINYGFNIDATSNSFAQATLFIGQTYSFNAPSEFLKGTGFDDRFSDFLGRVGITVGDIFDLRYRFRLDHDNLNIKRNELSANIGQKILRLKINYLILPEVFGESPEKESKQLGLSLSSEFIEGWTATIGTIRQTGRQSKPLAHKIKLAYLDECFQFDIIFSKDFYSDRDLKPGKNILFRIALKNLGEFRQTRTFGRE